MTLQLDRRLEFDSTFILDLTLCQVRLSHNAAFPWVLLIPRRPDISEIIDLNSIDQQLLMSEISLVSQAMKYLFHPTKLNVANLGNIIPQLHIHIIARYEEDLAWPGPVWNSGVTLDYDAQEQIDRIEQFKNTIYSATVSS